LRRFSERFFGVKVSLAVVFVLFVLFGVVVWSLTLYSLKVAVGEVRVVGVGVGVYWDSNCDNRVDFLSWGKIVVNPLIGEVSKNVTVCVRNEGSAPIVVRLNASNWSPANVEKYVRLSWDYDGRVLDSDETVTVTLTLSVDSGIWFESPRIQDYSFEIIVSAT